MLPAQPGLQYLYGQDGYLFPRSDHVVIGGTFEVGVNNDHPVRVEEFSPSEAPTLQATSCRNAGFMRLDLN